jgi:hypothetical protein
MKHAIFSVYIPSISAIQEGSYTALNKHFYPTRRVKYKFIHDIHEHGLTQSRTFRYDEFVTWRSSGPYDLACDIVMLGHSTLQHRRMDFTQT